MAVHVTCLARSCIQGPLQGSLPVSVDNATESPRPQNKHLVQLGKLQTETFPPPPPPPIIPGGLSASTAPRTMSCTTSSGSGFCSMPEARVCMRFRITRRAGHGGQGSTRIPASHPNTSMKQRARSAWTAIASGYRQGRRSLHGGPRHAR